MLITLKVQSPDRPPMYQPHDDLVYGTSYSKSYPAAWRTEQTSAFPDPPGMAAIGVRIAVSQSFLAIRPLTTYKQTL